MFGLVYAGISETSIYDAKPLVYEQRRKFAWSNIKVYPSYHGDSM